MRLSTVLLLVALALCCYEANSMVCPALAEEMGSYLMTPMDKFRRMISQFGPSEKAFTAKLTVKRCTDQLSTETKALFQEIMIKMLEDCNKRDVTNTIF